MWACIVLRTIQAVVFFVKPILGQHGSERTEHRWRWRCRQHLDLHAEPELASKIEPPIRGSQAASGRCGAVLSQVGSRPLPTLV